MRAALALLLAALLAPAPALAHKLKVFAAAEGASIVGTAYFAGGAKAAGAAGLVQAGDGAVIERFVTDAEGGFRLQARSRTDHSISVDSGDGHWAAAAIAAEELPASLPAGPAAAKAGAASLGPEASLDPIEAAVARQIIPLRRQLDAYEERIRLHDVLGGIGTIFGLFGIAAWLSARRRSP